MQLPVNHIHLKIAILELREHDACLRRERFITRRHKEVLYLSNPNGNNNWMLKHSKDHPILAEHNPVVFTTGIEGVWEETATIDKQYFAELKAQDPEERRKWLYGDWDLDSEPITEPPFGDRIIKPYTGPREPVVTDVIHEATVQFDHAADAAVYSMAALQQAGGVMKRNCNRYKWLWIGILVASPLMFMILSLLNIFKDH